MKNDVQELIDAYALKLAWDKENTQSGNLTSYVMEKHHLSYMTHQLLLKDKEIENLRKPPITKKQLVKEMIKYVKIRGKQKKLLLLLSKGFCERNYLMSTLCYKSYSTLKILVSDTKKSMSKFSNIKDKYKIVASRDKNNPGYNLVINLTQLNRRIK